MRIFINERRKQLEKLGQTNFSDWDVLCFSHGQTAFTRSRCNSFLHLYSRTKYQLIPLQQKASWRLTWFPTYYMKLYREEFDENVFEPF